MSKFTKQRVMIVEDDEDILISLEQSLTASGYEICATAKDFETSLAKADETRPDTLIADISIEGSIDGIETAKHIKASLGIPIIFLSALYDDELIERVKSAGAFGFLLKPCNFKELDIMLTMAGSKQSEILDESKSIFKSMFENSPDPSFLMKGTTIVESNNSADKIFDLKNASKGRNLSPLSFAPEYLSDGTLADSRLKEELDKSANTGSTKFEWESFGRNNQIMFFEAECHSVNHTGIPPYYLTLRDITARKQAETVLRQNERRMEYMLVMNEMTDADEQEIIEFALEAGIRLTDSTSGFIALLNDAENIISIKSFYSKDMPQGVNRANHTMILSLEDAGILAVPVQKRKPIIMNAVDPNILAGILPRKHIDIRRMAMIPIAEKNKTVALMILANKHSEYAESDIQQSTIVMVSLWRAVCRRRIEAELRESRQKYMQIINNAAEFISLLKSDGTVLVFNDTLAAMLGGDPKDFEGKPYYDIFSPNFVGIVNSVFASMETTKCGTTIEHPANINDRFFFLRTNFQPLLTPTGEIYAVIGVSTDITERLYAEKALEDSERTLKAILDSSPIGICLSKNRRFEWSNPALNTMLGYPPDEHRLIDAKQLYKSREEFERIGNELYPGLKENGSARIETEFIRTDGTILNVLLMANSVDRHDPDAGQIFAIMDITERKQLEREFVRMMELKLENERERNEIGMLVANNARVAAIGVVAGGITHEINQPLNAIRIASDGILSWDKQNNSVLPPQISKLIKRISDAAIRIDSIIKHMRSFWTENETGMPETLNLNDMLDKTLGLVEQRIMAHSINVVKNYSPAVPLIKANEVQMEIVVSNLIINALNFLDITDYDNKRIVLSTFLFEKQCVIEVADNGPGLPDVEIDKLFDPFYSTRRAIGGTGLGLAIVKMFTDRFNGIVTAYNNADGGATFRITFPSAEYAESAS